MRPKPKYREMNLVNPNERPVIRDIAESETGSSGTYYVDVSDTHGNSDSTYHMMWPDTLVLQSNVQDRAGMRLREICLSKWDEDNDNLSSI